MPKLSEPIYLIDSNVIIDIKRRVDHQAIYDGMSGLVDAGRLKILRQVDAETKYDQHPALRAFMNKNRSEMLVPIEEQYTENVSSKITSILSNFPKLVNVTGGTAADPADPWLISVAGVYGFTLVTNENHRSPDKIPAACLHLDHSCLCIRGPQFLLHEGIVGAVDYGHVDPRDFFDG